MSRPKGSKNKKTLLSQAQLDDKIAQKQAAKAKLEEELQRLLVSMDDLKLQVRAKKKEIKAEERAIAGLEEKKEQAAAIAAAAEQKKEVEKVVSSLISSGKSADEILEMLKK